MSDDATAKTIEGIRALVSSDQFKALNDYKLPMNIFRLMGTHGNEHVHSNILAWLLNPNESHGLGRRFLDGFLLELPNCEPSEKSEKEKCTLDEFVDTLNCDPVIKREKYFVENTKPDQQESQSNPPTDVENSNNEKQKRTYADLVVDFPSAKIVIGIENKIWAGEQPDQIANYQKHLVDYYSDYSQRFVIFLSPFGKQPTTQHQNDNRVPVLVMSYHQIKKLVEDQFSSSTAPVQEFLKHIIHHFTEDILGLNKIQHLCLELNKKYPEAYRNMIQYLPDLSPLLDTYWKNISSRYPELEMDFYPSKGRMLEIMVWDRKWRVQWENELMQIKLFLDFDGNAKMCIATGKKGLGQSYFTKEGKEIKPRVIREGYWWLSLEREPVLIGVSDAFGEQTAQAVEKIFDELYEIALGIHK